MNKQTEIIGKGTDQQVVIFYYLLVCIGLIAIFSVEYRFDDPFWETLIGLKKNYSKQLLYLLISSVFAAVILLIDSKFFAASAKLFYFFGVVLMLLTFVIGKDISGSRSWIVLGGGFNLQPAELCKVFTSLALAKYMSRQDTDFTKTRSHVIAISLALFPALLSIAQKETGLALVYFSFFLVLFREGLPANYLITGFSVAVLFVTSIVMPLQYYNILIGAVALIIVYIQWRRIRKKYTRLLGILFIAGLCIGIKYFVDYVVFDKILKP
jgi:rod shape determining protein RodA